MTICYIGLGSNIEDRREHIARAVKMLRHHPDIRVMRMSSIYETEPVSVIKQGMFLNGVLELKTRLKPRALLKTLNDIEHRLGRVRQAKDAPRTIDLDILYYGNEKVHEHDLVIPHPKIGEREFVLKGLRELGKMWVPPISRAL